MSDYNDSLTVQELCEKYSLLNAYITKLERENQSLAKRNIELENYLIELKKYYKELAKL
jgi:prefoldin subunit 5